MKREYQVATDVRYFSSLIYAEFGVAEKEEALFRLASFCGPAVEISVEAPFDHTSYYQEEMGEGLKRCFVVYESLLSREHLAHLKWVAQKIEGRNSREGGRVVNIDPGFIALEQVVLASAKGFPHKVYLSEGIYADVVLIRREGSFRALPWTFPDYAEAKTIEWFNGQRGKLSLALKSRRKTQ